MDQSKAISITPSLANVVSGAIGASLTPAQLTAISRGDVDLVGGCIRHLYYGSSSKDLDFVAFDNGDSISSTTVSNLGDFREGFECAAKYGFGATICVNKETKRLSMLNLYPCLCDCKDGKGHGQRAEAFRGLSQG